MPVSTSRYTIAMGLRSSRREIIPIRLASRIRPFHVPGTARNIASTLPPLVELSAEEETQDITTMDKLLKAVKKQSGHISHSAVPMRSPMLWSEALLQATKSHEMLDTREERQSASAVPTGSLPSRSMGDSYTELLLPFGSSSELLEQYTNASGGIRTGKLLEHLDSLAGSIAYKHMLPGIEVVPNIQDMGFYIVTASVDRLDVLAPLDPSRDIRLSGQVIHTGRSSMEVAVKMEAVETDGTEETLMLGRFSMVCRDALKHGSRPVNPLVRSTLEEVALYSMGEALKKRRQSNALRSLSRVPPNSSEAEALHSFFLRHGQSTGEIAHHDHLDQERVWIGDTRLEKCMLMFPQERNVHQKIFGGYLMRLAYELGYASSSLFTRHHVRFLSLDGISFARPVPIGSILRLTSRILYSTSSTQFPALVHVGVRASVADVETGQEQTTNEFRFTWCREDGKPLTRIVVPKTYQEAMLWLEGKRALEIGAEIRGLRSN